MAHHTVLPHVNWTKAFLLTAVALIGTTITPYIQLYTAGAVVDRGSAPRSTSTSGSTPVAGRSSGPRLHVHHHRHRGLHQLHPQVLNLAADAARALEPLAGQFSSVLFGIGLLGASALAAAVVPLSTSYAVAEAVGVERRSSKSFKEAPLFLGPLQRPDPGSAPAWSSSPAISSA